MADKDDRSLKVFVLGDSRTGTMSMHNFFLHNGLSSLHYFVKEAGQTKPLHEQLKENTKNFFDFMESTECQCFCDYPTRFYYKALFDIYPDAYFILTRRTNTDVWASSMIKFFGKFGHKPDMDELRSSYETVNEDIRKEARDRKSKFLELCIDEPNEDNSLKLAEFLGLSDYVPIGHDNASADIDNELLSQTHTIFPFAGPRTIELMESRIAPSKSVLSEFGWVFLANDTNSFLNVQFGQLAWTEDETNRALAVIAERKEALKNRGSLYFKFIVPEKSVVYDEYLPKSLQRLAKAPVRPAHLMAKDSNIVYYLDRYLKDAKSYGQLYFRGDSHTNWLGAWFVYHFIMRRLSNRGLVPFTDLVKFKELTPSVASYEGDLATQLDSALSGEFERRWGTTKPEFGFDLTLKLDIQQSARKATRRETPAHYKEWFPSRETLVFEREDGVGLRAVIFRDSTLDFCHELIAQHFRRSVFVWHQGQVFENVIRDEKPDIVLHIMAERFVIKYPDFRPIVPDPRLSPPDAAPSEE